MNPEQTNLLETPLVADYSKIESRTLLLESVRTQEALNYTWAALLVLASLHGKEVTANGLSERAKHIEAQARETLRNYQSWCRDALEIESEIVRRIWRNSTNGNFAKFKIGVLRNDYVAQKEALEKLQQILRGIPWTNDWFHEVGHQGMDSLTNLLVVKELGRHQHLDLPTTLEHAMDNKFAYLYVAGKRDLLDEIDKYRRRPFETHRDVDEASEDGTQAKDMGEEDPESMMVEKLDRQRSVIRLREIATDEANAVDQRIIDCAADLLTDKRLLANASRAELVLQVSTDARVTPQYVRQRLGTDRIRTKIKQALQVTEARPRVVLTDGDKEK